MSRLLWKVDFGCAIQSNPLKPMKQCLFLQLLDITCEITHKNMLNALFRCFFFLYSLLFQFHWILDFPNNKISQIHVILSQPNNKPISTWSPMFTRQKKKKKSSLEEKPRMCQQLVYQVYAKRLISLSLSSRCFFTLQIAVWFSA